MAKRSDKPAVSDEGKLAEMRKRYQLASEHCAELYDMAREDIRFVSVPGEQWDVALKKRRGHRPTYEFPKLRSYIRQIINEQKQTRPQGKVRGVDDSDRGLAELMQGLCRNIESSSNADQAYDIAFDKAVKGGFGVWGIKTDYLNQDDFDQDISIVPKRNPFAVKFDPAAVSIDRRDGLFAFEEDLIPEETFKRAYPKADLTDFGSDECSKDWREAGQVRIAVYWYKEPLKREVWALSTGAVVMADEAGFTEEELLTAGITVTQRRTVEGHKVYSRLTNGRQFLTEPVEFPSKYIPLVPAWGNIENIDGTDYWSGEVRHAKDQQRLHNVHRTALVEAVAKAPKAPYILDPSWIEGYEEMWKKANSEDYPYLLAHLSKSGGNIPKRTEQAQVPTALIQLAGMDTDDMKASTGQHDASLGSRSNETSGIAINSRKQQGATATFNYIDNLVYAIRFTYEILIDMIPKVYDTARTVRILGEDGGAKWKQLYQEVQDEEGNVHVINDIRNGKYDVTVTVGANFATQRMETAAIYADMASQIGGAHPAIGPLLAYGVIKNQDATGMEEIDAAMRKILVGQGLLEPKEGEQPPAPPPPDPRAEMEAKQMAAKAMLDEAKAIEMQGKAQMQPAQLEKLIAETVALQLKNALQDMALSQPAPFGQAFNEPDYGPPPPAPYQSYEQPAQAGFSLPAGG